MRIKYCKYVTINSVNLLYLIFSKANEYFKEINKNEYSTLVPTNASQERIKKCEKIWSKIRDLNGSITKDADNYDEKYRKSNLIWILPLNKTIEIYS